MCQAEIDGAVEAAADEAAIATPEAVLGGWQCLRMGHKKGAPQGAPPCGTKIANMLGDFWYSVILQYITIINHPFFRGNFGPFPNGKKGKLQDSSKENMCLLQVLMENFIDSQSGYFTCLIKMGRHLGSYFL